MRPASYCTYFFVVVFLAYPTSSSELISSNPTFPLHVFASQASVFRLACRLLYVGQEEMEMDTVVIAGALIGSFAGAFVLQKAALEGLFRMMNADRRLKH
jgi:hypothetical protein